VLRDDQVAAALHDLAQDGFALLARAEDGMQVLAKLTEVTDQDFTIRFFNPRGAKITAAARHKPEHHHGAIRPQSAA